MLSLKIFDEIIVLSYEYLKNISSRKVEYFFSDIQYHSNDDKLRHIIHIWEYYAVSK